MKYYKGVTMTFISTRLVGTLIYETIQKELYTDQEIVAHALKECYLSKEDIELITQDFVKASDKHKSSKENLIEYFAYEAEHTPQIVKKYIVLANKSGSIATDLNYQK